MKAIDTIYNGYKFRSRLEARWAVFFDELDIKYDYEVEGFDLGDAGWYLPDFWLPDIQAWIEIKHIPNHIGNADEDKKARALRDETGFPVLICGGAPKESWHRFYGYWENKGILESCESYATFQSSWCYSREIEILVIEEDPNFAIVNNGNQKLDTVKTIYQVAEDLAGEDIKKDGNVEMITYYMDLIDKDEVRIFDITKSHARTCKAAVKARQARFEHGECGK